MKYHRSFTSLKKLIQMDVSGGLNNDEYLKSLQLVHDIGASGDVDMLQGLYKFYYLETYIISNLKDTIWNEINKYNVNFFNECEALKLLICELSDFAKKYSKACTDEERQQLKNYFCEKHGSIAFENALEFIE